jgi:hypothetical protein
MSLAHAEALLHAAPALRALDADLNCFTAEEARDALRANKGEPTPLRVHGLRIFARGASEADVLALAADMAVHAWLQELHVSEMLTRTAVDALVDAALARRLTAVQFVNCGLSPAAVPALARLLGSSALGELLVWGLGDVAALLDAPAAMLLAGALRTNSTLTTLQLGAVALWRDATAAAMLLGALTAHPSVRSLSLRQNFIGRLREAEDRAAVGTSLGVLLAANAPALTELNFAMCNLGDAGMEPLLEALRHNTHLRSLDCASNDITEAFAADVLLPAVRANTGLRALDASNWIITPPGAREAKELVARRV